MTKFIGYIRVSMDKQGRSGQGPEDQPATVLRHAASDGGELVTTFTEVESGRKRNRPELDKAMAQAKRTGGTLVIAKLDTLARDATFVSALMESGVPFVACGNPHATRMIIHILAAVVEEEARSIGTRTREALAAYKARGGRLGTPENLTPDAQRKGADANRRKALQADAKVLPLMRVFRTEGKGIKAIATALNEAGCSTESGRPWSPMRVKRALQRAGIYTDAGTTVADSSR